MILCDHIFYEWLDTSSGPEVPVLAVYPVFKKEPRVINGGGPGFNLDLIKYQNMHYQPPTTNILEPDLTTTENSSAFCKLPNNLGPINVDMTKVELAWVETLYPQVERGGMYTPSNCIPKHKVCIIVSYRDREEHLAIFLRHIHPFLMNQKLEYSIYVVEQTDNKEFNKGMLYNAAFLETQVMKPDGCDCLIFQDVDLLPLDSRNIYSCPKQPRHMSVVINSRYRFIYDDNNFGGVSAIKYEQFVDINGYSNQYWGWGGEDDDISIRLRHKGYFISRYSKSIARYIMLPHVKRKPVLANRARLKHTIANYPHDGLNNIQYHLVGTMENNLYTLIQIDVDKYLHQMELSPQNKINSNESTKYRNKRVI
ncbi:beta-1,4-N-acetylgalactosaminyltransferase bre-4-like isoform X3 [Hyposmocoma kahamanoa]|uniref:beta-1,4-N-acetylgalactosaminyltransferase bre-4-like isoform X2 n=1 Tax=Hyposmocoma kahamanoa TaxID=1477025 RepID=UPI000E6D6768|nr:beta-1,4-N-acetylgalactosaminyltransferase bre-4-like isoform X2 [Hyposmocoma kahamanoa]XP_026321271.1 beta-1,4-N-acetylgalactosaminyltransferase bre-4-like isoform X3 [Hyposmocoma kahamanoa]